LPESDIFTNQKRLVSPDQQITEKQRFHTTTAATSQLPFSAWTLLVGWQEEHPACKKTEW